MNFQANLEALLENTSGTYYLCLNKEGYIIYSNIFFKKIFGIPVNYESILKFESLVSKEDNLNFLYAIEECRKTPGETSFAVLSLFRNDGSRFWVRWEFYALTDEEGNFNGYQLLGHDFTESKRTELEQVENEYQVNTLLNNIDEGFILLNNEFRLVLYNNSANEKIRLLTGKPLEAGVQFNLITSEDIKEKINKALDDALQGFETERIIKSPHSNAEAVFFFHFKPVDFEDSKGIIITCRNITQRVLAEEKLLEKERYFRTLIQDSADGIVLLGDDYSVKYVSDAAEKILEYSKEEIFSKGIAPFIPKEFHDLLYYVYNSVTAFPGNIVKNQTMVNTASGRRKWIEFTVKNMLYDKTVRAIVINFSNITSRKEVEKALQASEEKYKYLFYSNPQPMWIFDNTSLRFLDVNGAAVNHYGYSKKEFLNMSILDIRPEEDQAGLLKRIEALKRFSGLTSEGKIWRHTKKNGEIVFVEIKSHSIDYSGRKATLVSVNDISQLVQADKELQRSNDRFYYALKAGSEAIWERDIETGEYVLQDLYNKINGFTPERIVHINDIANYIHPDDTAEIGKTVTEAIKNPKVDAYNLQYRFFLEDGSTAFHKVSAWIIRDENGKALKVMGSLADITEQKSFERELMNSYERFRLAGKATSDAIWDADLEKETIHWGEGFETLFGYRLKTNPVPGDIWIDNIYQHDKERVLEKHYAALKDPETDFWQDEYRFVKADGSIAYVADRGIIIREEGKAVRVIGAMQDISIRKKIEEQLRQEKNLLRVLIDHLPDYIQFRDKEHKLVVANTAYLKLIGVEAENLATGTTQMNYFSDGQAKAYMKADQKIMESGVPLFNKEEVIITHKGEKRWILTTKIPFRDSKGNIHGIVDIGRDVTERKAMEVSLQKTRNKFSIISEASNDAIWDVDLEKSRITWSRAMFTSYGYQPKEIQSRKQWLAKIHEKDRKKVLLSLSTTYEKKSSSWETEYRFKASNGDYKYVIDRGYILYDENNEPYRMIGSMIDITDRRRLERKLAQQELRKQRLITEATIQGQEKERIEIGRELHDNINQILTTTKLYLDLAINEEDIREELLKKCYNNISLTIEEVRLLSKSLVPPSLGDIGIIEAIAEMVSDINKTGMMTISLDAFEEEAVEIDDSLKLMVFRIVQEQVNNILKHSQATEAEINLIINQNSLNLIIKDNGIGFDISKKINGIGLKNISGRAELYNGDMKIISSPGKGCTLKVEIPINDSL